MKAARFIKTVKQDILLLEDIDSLRKDLFEMKEYYREGGKRTK